MMDWISGISAMGTLLIGLGTCALGVVAVCTFRSGLGKMEESQSKIQEGKFGLEESAARRNYQFEVAKRAANSFGQLKPAFRRIRNPFGSLDEFEKGKEMYGVYEGADGKPSQDLRQSLIFLYRMSWYETLFADISKLQSEFFTVFGTEEPFQELWSIRGEILKAADMLDVGGNSSEDIKNYHYTLYSTNENDLIGSRINQIVNAVHKICIPVLRV